MERGKEMEREGERERGREKKREGEGERRRGGRACMAGQGRHVENSATTSLAVKLVGRRWRR